MAAIKFFLPPGYTAHSVPSPLESRLVCDAFKQCISAEVILTLLLRLGDKKPCSFHLGILGEGNHLVSHSSWLYI